MIKTRALEKIRLTREHPIVLLLPKDMANKKINVNDNRVLVKVEANPNMAHQLLKVKRKLEEKKKERTLN